MSTIGQKIKEHRELNHYTQDELGALCGTTKQTIFKYESGIVTNIPMDRLMQIASALGVTPAYLMGWEDDLEHAASGEGPAAADPGAPDAPARLSAPEEQLLDNFRQLNDEGQELVTNYTSDLVATGRYIKSHPAQLAQEA